MFRACLISSDARCVHLRPRSVDQARKYALTTPSHSQREGGACPGLDPGTLSSACARFGLGPSFRWECAVVRSADNHFRGNDAVGGAAPAMFPDPGASPPRGSRLRLPPPPSACALSHRSQTGSPGQPRCFFELCPTDPKRARSANRDASLRSVRSIPNGLVRPTAGGRSPSPVSRWRSRPLPALAATRAPPCARAARAR